MRLVSLAIAAALGATALPGFADPVSGTVSGVWTHPNPSAAPIVTSGVGTPTFTWGAPQGTPANNVKFDNGGGSFSSSTETKFKVGTITYFNGTTTSGTTPDSVDLALTLDFADPALGPVTSDYAFKIVTTTNTDDPDASADYLYLPTAFSSTSFLIGNTTYNVKLADFENILGDGFLPSDEFSLNVREGGTASADLFAVVTTQTTAVPEPQSVALMLAGLGMMGLVARRRGV
jgi:PEP-CTERM motif